MINTNWRKDAVVLTKILQRYANGVLCTPKQDIYFSNPWLEQKLDNRNMITKQTDKSDIPEGSTESNTESITVIIDFIQSKHCTL